MPIFINPTDEGFATQIDTFCQNIDTYSAALGLSAGQVTAVKKDRDAFIYSYKASVLVDAHKQEVTKYKNLLRYGNGSEVLPAFPAAPTLPAAPAAVDANVQGRFQQLVKQITANPVYTQSMGEALLIEAAVTPFDPNTGKPVFKIEFSSGGFPNIIWKKGKFQGVEIWKSTDGKSYSKLATDLSPDYIDKSALPAAGETAVWHYKLIYIYKDEVAGNWSGSQSVTVFGAV